MACYYSQRASAGLIITESTQPGPMGRGYNYPPGLHAQEQAMDWRAVTDAVHAGGGRILVQLMYAGRVSLVASSKDNRSLLECCGEPEDERSIA